MLHTISRNILLEDSGNLIIEINREYDPVGQG